MVSSVPVCRQRGSLSRVRPVIPRRLRITVPYRPDAVLESDEPLKVLEERGHEIALALIGTPNYLTGRTYPVAPLVAMSFDPTHASRLRPEVFASYNAASADATSASGSRATSTAQPTLTVMGRSDPSGRVKDSAAA